MTRYMTAAEAIDLSVAENRIVFLPYTDDRDTDLHAACDDSVHAGDIVEFRGTRDDGAEWRVHLQDGG